jgi:hypothetical protein
MMVSYYLTAFSIMRDLPIFSTRIDLIKPVPVHSSPEPSSATAIPNTERDLPVVFQVIRNINLKNIAPV